MWTKELIQNACHNQACHLKIFIPFLLGLKGIRNRKQRFNHLILPSSPTSLTSSRRPGYWLLARRAAAGDLWWVMVTMLLGEAVWPGCLWELGDEDGVRWGRREKLRVRPEDEEPWRREFGRWQRKGESERGNFKMAGDPKIKLTFAQSRKSV